MENPTMRSTLDVYAQQYADQLTPETKQILVRLADHVLKLVHRAYEADFKVMDNVMRERAERREPTPDPLQLLPRDPSSFRARMRGNEPALGTLSDEELDVAIDVLSHLHAEGHAAGEVLAEEDEYMTEEKRERMSAIARWAL
jgi:hypothetical protein